MGQSRFSRDDFLAIVEAGIQAPSADNRHRLGFEQSAQSIRIWGEDELAALQAHRRVLWLLSLGAVVENMVLLARSRGFEASLRWFPDPAAPRLAASLDLSGAQPVVEDLVQAIPHRHTNRKFFHGPRMTSAHQQLLEREAGAASATRLIWLDERAIRGRALALIRLAETERFRCEELHQELFSSVRFDVGWSGVAEQGLSPGSLEVEWPLRGAFRQLGRWSVMHALSRLGAHYLLGLRAADALCRFAPHVGAIATNLSLNPGALAVGRAFERVWLQATVLGMALQPFAASTLMALEEYEDIRPAIRQKLAQGWAQVAPGWKPLIVFRLGRSSPASVRSGRQPLACYLR